MIRRCALIYLDDAEGLAEQVVFLARRCKLDSTSLQSAALPCGISPPIKLKASWGLPQALRELIGAIYALPPMQVRGEQMVMRLGAAMKNDEPQADLERLQRLAGLA